MKMTAETIHCIKEDAIKRYPEESCGVIIDGHYISISNIHPEPTKQFRLDPLEYATVGTIDAIIHSHTNGSKEPSELDMIQQARTGLPWGILSCNGPDTSEVIWLDPEGEQEPLIGRSFLHGINDCYSLVRAWYKEEKNITLKDFPRNNNWWDKGENLYVDHCEDAGFRVLDKDEPLQIGDVFSMRIKSPVPNHGGVYIGDGKVLHHLNGQLSRRQQLGRWKDKIDYWIRLK